MSSCSELFARVTDHGADYVSLWESAFQEDRGLAVRILLWSYDIGEGAGRREPMRSILPLIVTDRGIPIREKRALLEKVARLGRYDMLSELLNLDTLPSKAVHVLIDIISRALDDASTAARCAKWMPRQGKAANRIRGMLGVTPKQWRSMLASYPTAEQLMSAGRWQDIDYARLPAVCLRRNAEAFRRHDAKRFDAFLAEHPVSREMRPQETSDATYHRLQVSARYGI